jgi:uncharacterized protein YrrD
MTTDTFTNARKRRVVASDTAESVGSVKGFILDPGGRRIEAIHIDGHGRHAAILDWSAVAAFGADVVMAHAGDNPSSVGSDHEKAAVKGAVTMLGTRVLTTGGAEVGTVADVEFDTDSGDVVRIFTDEGSIDAARLRSLGSYALVIDDPAPSKGRR